MNGELKNKLEAIVKAEGYKRDTFFFCGSTTDAPPNELLMKCGQDFLATENNEAKACLLDILEMTVAPYKEFGDSDVPKEIANMIDVIALLNER